MEPWDIPPFPDHGDADPNVTFAAVGRAMSEWERLELYLARLYAKFLDIPTIEAIARPEYARVAVSRERARAIEAAAAAYFVRHPNQELDAEFEAMICDARKLATRRNDIAHGVVDLAWGIAGQTHLGDALERDEYMLIPGEYVAKLYGPDRKPAYLLRV
jgi:Holliday junction resolvase-like predicted endonuclease